MIRMLRPGLLVHAYEPLPTEAAVFRAVHGGRSEVNLHELALGDGTGTVDLHVSARADSSSLLPISRQQTQLFPKTKEIGTQPVQLATLDSLSLHWLGANKALLKLDVQGFELNVLRGAVASLKHCAYDYVECSEIVLYEGQALRSEVETFLSSQKFEVRGCFNEQWHKGRVVQADWLFERIS